MPYEKIPKKRAAALKYSPEEDAVPILAAFGEGYVAERMVEVAGESGVPVLPDPDLTAMLARMSVGDEIPPELYGVVAKVLVFVSEVDQDFGKRLRRATDGRG